VYRVNEDRPDSLLLLMYPELICSLGLMSIDRKVEG